MFTPSFGDVLLGIVLVIVKRGYKFKSKFAAIWMISYTKEEKYFCSSRELATLCEGNIANLTSLSHEPD